ncbi:hypothetical protein ACFPYL_01175 [Nocardioides hankookensis]|uniref:Uncharacterized protein n=1 Tax=Nocardioides hankookensis TaxID=443157 RepID=A0ABW1LDW6_9ACTN
MDQRLDDLVARAYAAGEEVNRRTLLAALLLNADFSGEELRDILHRYRVAQVKDAPLQAVDANGQVLHFRRHKPGPRASG